MTDAEEIEYVAGSTQGVAGLAATRHLVDLRQTCTVLVVIRPDGTGRLGVLPGDLTEQPPPEVPSDGTPATTRKKDA